MSQFLLACCYHIQGRCDRGETCRYSHEAVDGRPCQFGESCRLQHWKRGWERDGVSQKCRRCGKEFGLFTRRHHCRLGGELCCAACLTEAEPFGKVCQQCLAHQQAQQLRAEEQDRREEARHRDPVAGGGAAAHAPAPEQHQPAPRIIADTPAAAAMIRAQRAALTRFGAGSAELRALPLADYTARLVAVLQQAIQTIDELLEQLDAGQQPESNFALHPDPIAVPADRTAPLLSDNAALRGTGSIGWVVALPRLEAEAVPDVERRRAMGAEHDFSMTTSLGKLLTSATGIVARTVGRLQSEADQSDTAEGLRAAVAALHADGTDPAVGADEMLAAALYTMNLAQLPGQSANPSLFAVANLLCRLARDPSLRRPRTAAGHEVTHAEVLAMLRVYAPFIIRVDTFLCRLPQERRTLFRGVNRHFDLALYGAGAAVAWGAMTSTSDSLRVAQSFAKGRTLVIVQAGSTAMIDFLSDYAHERETLLPSFTLFTSLGVTSPGLLRMLGQQGSIISLRELGDAPSAEEVVAGMIEAKQVMRELGAKFLQTYVPARVSLTPPPVPDDAECLALLDGLLPQFLHRRGDFAGDSTGTHLALVGDGGTGKTTALLALHCFLASHTWPFELERPVISVFVALPKLADVQNGALIDAQVFAELGATSAEHAAEIAQHATIVVLLDSLDECVVRSRRAWQPLLDGAPFCREHCRCIVSTRSEFRDRVPAGAELFCSGGACKTMFVLPLTEADERDFVRRFCVAHEAEVDDVQRCLARLQLAEEDARLPVLLTMALEIALQDARLGAPRGVYAAEAPALAEPQAGGGAVAGDATQTEQQQQHPEEPTSWKRHDLDAQQWIAYDEATMQRIERGNEEEQQTTLTFDSFTIDLEKFLHLDNEREDEDDHQHICRFAGERIVSGLDAFEECDDWQCREAAAELRAEQQPAAGATHSPPQEPRERAVDLAWLPPPGTRAHVFERFLDARRTAPITDDHNAKIDETIPLAAHQNLIELLQDAALRMLAAGDWSEPVGSLRQRCLDAVPRSQRKNESQNDVLLRIFSHHIPCRVEAVHDDGSAFAFWHKSLTEYLCARALFLSPTDSLAKLSASSFSKREPGVLRAFNDICSSDPQRHLLVSLGPLFAAVRSASPHTRSNAFALLSAGGLSLGGCDFSNIDITDCNLQEAELSGANLRGARIANSILRNARLDEASVDGLALLSNRYSSPLPPLEGHEIDVSCLAFSPDGQLIASGDLDGSIRVWSATTGRELALLRGHNNAVYSVAFSPSGDRLVSGSDDNSVRVWSTSTGEQLMRLDGHTDSVISVAFAPDGQRVASGSRDNTVRVWSLETRQAVTTLTGHSYWVNCVAYSPCGSMLASGGYDTTAIIWEAATGAERLRFSGHSGSVESVSFSADSRRVVSGDDSGTIIVWDTATGGVVKEIAAHGDITSIGFLPDGVRVFSGSRGEPARLWDVASGRELQQLTEQGDAVAFSRDGRRFVAAQDNRVVVNNLAAAAAIKPRVGHTAAVESLAFFDSGRRLFSAGADYSLCIWDVASVRLIKTMREPRGKLNCGAITPDGSLAASHSDNDILLWDVASGSVASRLSGHTDRVDSVAFSPSGDRLVSGGGGWDNSVRVWSTSTGEQLMQLDGHIDWVRAVAFAPDGVHVASGSDDSTVHVWSLETREAVMTLTGHSSDVNCVAYSPCGRMLASGGYDNTVIIWDAATGAERLRLRGHSGSVSSVAFSADSRRVVSGDDSGTIIVWDTATGARITTLNGHSDCVNSVAFSPSGAIASGSHDHTIRIARLEASSASLSVSLPPHIRADQLRRVELVDDAQRLAIVVAADQNTRRRFVADLCSQTPSFVKSNQNQQQQLESSLGLVSARVSESSNNEIEVTWPRSTRTVLARPDRGDSYRRCTGTLAGGSDAIPLALATQ